MTWRDVRDQMNWREMLPVALQILVMIVAGVWVVASVQATTLVLGAQIGALTSSIDDLRETLREQDQQIQLNRSEISEIRGRLNGNRK